MTWLGVCINTLNMTLTVPDFRLEELQDILSSWLNKTHFSKRELQQLLGKLSFVTACVRPGRAFSCRLINALRLCFACPRHQQCLVTDALLEEFVWWKHFLQHYNGVSVIPTNVTVSNPDLFACDPRLDVCGAVCLGEFFHAPFPLSIAAKQLNISQLELFTILIPFKFWQARLRGCTVEILTDNQVSVYALNNQRSSDHFMQCCLREIWLLLALNNIHSSRAPHLWSNQCVSWFFKPLSFSRHLRSLRGACCNIPGSPPSFPWWFDVRFYRVLATLAPLSFHIGYLLINLEQARHIFSAFHSVFHYFLRRSQRCLTVFAAVPGIYSDLRISWLYEALHENLFA